MGFLATIKSYFIGLFIKDVAPILLTTVKSVVVSMASTDMTGTEKKAAAMAAVKAALTTAGVTVANDIIDSKIEEAVAEL
jgi:hypothetical protein